jgi:hypothetical protein
MTDAQRGALAVLAELWAPSSDVRLGQLFAHIGFLGEVHLDRGLGYLEDDEMIAVMYRRKAELGARLQSAPSQTIGPNEAAAADCRPILPQT